MKFLVELAKWTVIWLLLFAALYGVAVWLDPSLAPRL